jgi:RNA polymerase sigma-70 factor (ECF subfamily)
VARAAARLEAGDAAGVLAALDAMPADRTERYQPWHVVRMRALDRLGRTAEATEAADRALALTTDPGVRSFLAATGAARRPTG